MTPRSEAGRNIHAFALAMTCIAAVSVGAEAQTPENPGQVRRWPCRLVIKPTLLEVVEDGWERSKTLQRQCDELAGARAVVVLEWGKAADSQLRAKAHVELRDGVVVARILIPPGSDAIELVAHELQHVIERVRGLDFKAESKRPGSGVWRAFHGYETTAAIEAGRQVAKELRDAPRRPGGARTDRQ
jgi:hypothetical protein